MEFTEPPEPRQGRRAYVAWALSYLAYATYYAGRKGFSVAKKPMEHELGIGRDELALIDTGYLIFYSAGQFVHGILGDRVGARRLVGFGLLASAAACAAFGSASTTAMLVIAFAANGFAQATGWPGTVRTMAEWTTPANRRPVMAFWSTCYQVGGVGATTFAAWSLRFGFRWVFFLPALVLVLVGCVVLAFLRPGPTEIASELTSDEDREAGRAARKAALGNPILWCFGGSYFAIKLIRYSLLFWAPYYLSDSLGYGAADAGYLSVAFEVGGTAGVIGMGLVTHRMMHVSRSLLSAGTLVGLALALILYTYVAPLGAVANVCGLALIGACLFGPDSVISGAAAQDAGGPRAAATAAGLVNGVGSVGAILQGGLNAWVSRVYGWQAVFYVLIALAFASAVALVPAVIRERARS
jgi:OPA family sugar phosphate sensor protein UhpC-like MFS transporter